MPQFKHSCVLFVDPLGDPLEFYMRPCPSRFNVMQMVRHGGGIFCTNGGAGIRRLVEPRTKVINLFDGEVVLSVQYIYDCVEKNILLDPEPYTIQVNQLDVSDISDDDSNVRTHRSSPRKSSNTLTKAEETKVIDYVIGNSDDFSRLSLNQFCIQLSSSQIIDKSASVISDYLCHLAQNWSTGLPERKENNFRRLWNSKLKAPFSENDDLSMLDYIIQNNLYHRVQELSLFTEMYRKKVTFHCAAEMQQHFTQKILPNIGMFDISDEARSQILKHSGKLGKPPWKMGICRTVKQTTKRPLSEIEFSKTSSSSSTSKLSLRKNKKVKLDDKSDGLINKTQTLSPSVVDKRSTKFSVSNSATELSKKTHASLVDKHITNSIDKSSNNNTKNATRESGQKNKLIKLDDKSDKIISETQTLSSAVVDRSSSKFVVEKSSTKFAVSNSVTEFSKKPNVSLADKHIKNSIDKSSNHKNTKKATKESAQKRNLTQSPEPSLKIGSVFTLNSSAAKGIQSKEEFLSVVESSKRSASPVLPKPSTSKVTKGSKSKKITDWLESNPLEEMGKSSERESSSLVTIDERGKRVSLKLYDPDLCTLSLPDFDDDDSSLIKEVTTVCENITSQIESKDCSFNTSHVSSEAPVNTKEDEDICIVAETNNHDNKDADVIEVVPEPISVTRESTPDCLDDYDIAMLNKLKGLNSTSNMHETQSCFEGEDSDAVQNVTVVHQPIKEEPRSPLCEIVMCIEDHPAKVPDSAMDDVEEEQKSEPMESDVCHADEESSNENAVDEEQQSEPMESGVCHADEESSNENIMFTRKRTIGILHSDIDDDDREESHCRPFIISIIRCQSNNEQVRNEDAVDEEHQHEPIERGVCHADEESSNEKIMFKRKKIDIFHSDVDDEKEESHGRHSITRCPSSNEQVRNKDAVDEEQQPEPMESGVCHMDEESSNEKIMFKRKKIGILHSDVDDEKEEICGRPSIRRCRSSNEQVRNKDDVEEEQQSEPMESGVCLADEESSNEKFMFKRKRTGTLHSDDDDDEDDAMEERHGRPFRRCRSNNKQVRYKDTVDEEKHSEPMENDVCHDNEETGNEKAVDDEAIVGSPECSTSTSKGQSPDDAAMESLFMNEAVVITYKLEKCISGLRNSAKKTELQNDIDRLKLRMYKQFLEIHVRQFMKKPVWAIEDKALMTKYLSFLHGTSPEDILLNKCGFL